MPDHLNCPYCGSSDTTTWAKIPRRDMCLSCERTFRVYKVQPKEGVAIGSGATEIATPHVKKTDVAYKAVALFDPHLDPIRGYHPAYAVAKQFVKDIQPEIIIIGGDWCEFNSVSYWNKGKPGLMEGVRYNQEVEFGKRELEDIREASPDAEIIFLEGNHENRVTQFLESNPELDGTMNARKQLGIDELGIGWVPLNQLKRIGKLSYTHGMYYNKYFARTTLEAIGDNCMVGHAHKSQTWVQRLHYQQEPHGCWGIGCLCSTDPEWKRGNKTDFVNSFAIIEYSDSGSFNVHELIIVRGAFMYGGHTWMIN